MSRRIATEGNESPGWLKFVVAILFLDLLLILPNHPDAATPEALLLLPLELPILVLLLLFLPERPARWLGILTGVVLGLATAIKIADFLSNLSLGRPFSFVLDLTLFPAIWQLGVGNVGAIATVLAFLLIIALFVGLGILAAKAAGVIRRAGGKGSWMRPGAIGIAFFLLALFGGVEAGSDAGLIRSHTAAFTSHVLVDHASYVYEAAGDLSRFKTAARSDAYAGVPADRLLAGLKGHDVLLTFVESYGRTNIENPLYAETTKAALATLEQAAKDRGFVLRSAWLTSPVQGGGSWLAHETLMSGLKIDNQRRYDALLASHHDTLVHLFAKAGWDTVSVSPEITQAWPEGKALGYERIYDAAHLGYKGKAFNWITMPDQFTLSQLYNLALAPKDRPPVLAVTALISSHAPWTPLPRFVDWDAVGDGSIFNGTHRDGDAPEVVWRDPDRIRDQFRKSIDYSLRSLAGFIEKRMASGQILMFLGDHQPAPLVAGSNSGHDVPFVIIGPPDVMAALDSWNWTPSATPAHDAPVWPMEAFRDRFLAAFTPDAPKPQ